MPTLEILPAGTILVVDDTALNRQLLKAILRSSGHQVIEAADGETALAMAEEDRPDLMLLDIMMPGMDGHEVLGHLRSTESTAELPVILVSALDETSEKIKGLDLGAADYITKPFDRREVLARVRAQLRIRQLTQTLLQEQSRLHEDLCAAAELQTTLIPRSELSFPGLRIAHRFVPSDRIGGDLFNVVRLDDQHVAAYILDVAGHGVPSALITFSVAQSLSRHAGLVMRSDGVASPESVQSPGPVLTELDRQYPIERFGKHFTITYAVLDVESWQLRYSSAAHPWPIVLHPEGTVTRLTEGGSVIGLGGLMSFEEGEIDLAPGDRLMLTTDGLEERRNAAGEFFGSDRLEQLAISLRHRDIESFCDDLLEEVERHGAGEPDRDDISLLVIERPE
ncbi:MAG: fused response regulator/phosphatase [Thermoanaerobaculia bacterium]|nr:fused response regulator/phosphatase [Thermoanaerobaculia bacterium]